MAKNREVTIAAYRPKTSAANAIDNNEKPATGESPVFLLKVPYLFLRIQRKIAKTKGPCE